MGKKPKPSKTPLGDRLVQAREKLGFANQRAVFAETVGLTEPMLGYYERGDRKPDAPALSEYRTRHGVSLSWLITGEGDMFDDPSKAPAPSTKVDAWAMGRAYSVIERICRDIGRPVTGSQLAEEAADLYSALLGRVVDVRERPMVETALSLLAEETKERMISTKPGTGKRSAS